MIKFFRSQSRYIALLAFGALSLITPSGAQVPPTPQATVPAKTVSRTRAKVTPKPEQTPSPCPENPPASAQLSSKPSGSGAVQSTAATRIEAARVEKEAEKRESSQQPGTERSSTLQRPAAKPSDLAAKESAQTPNAVAERKPKEQEPAQPCPPVSSVPPPQTAQPTGSTAAQSTTRTRVPTRETERPEPAALQGSRPPIDKLSASEAMQSAKQSLSVGNAVAAREYLDHVRELDVNEQSSKDRAQVSFLTARSVEARAANVANDREKRELYREAKKAYEDAIRQGEETADPQTKSQAQNNLAVLYLREKQSNEAVKVFEGVDLKQVPRGSTYLFSYNYGRALESTGQKEAALRRYREALTHAPGFDPAAQGAFGLYRQISPPLVSEAADLADYLVQTGNAKLAGPELYECLRVWANEASSVRLVSSLMHYLLAEQITPTQFRAAELPRLKELPADAKVTSAARDMLVGAYLGNWKASFKPSETRASFPLISQGQAIKLSYSKLLQQLGDYFAGERQLDQALARYAAAWMVDDENLEAALNVATLMREHRAALDPDRVLFGQVVDLLFERKGGAYLRGDLENIRRFHVVLATIFEKEGHWARTGQADNALFQWEAALRAEERLKASQPNRAPSPGIHLRLASCYQREGQKEFAWDHYLRAAEGFIELRDPEQANAALLLATEMEKQGARISDAERTRFASIQERKEILASVMKPS